jgi:putative hemolysin
MDVDGSISTALIVVALLAASAFFVAAEFAVLTLRRRRFEQPEADPAIRAPAFSRASEVEEISLATQLGSVSAVLLLGYLTATTALSMFGRLLPWAAIALGVLIAASVYSVLGQQIPRVVGAHHATWVTHPAVYLPLRALSLLLRPLVLPLLFVLDRILDGFNLSRSAFLAPVHTLEDIRELVAHGHEQGVVEEDEREMIHGVFEFSATVAREVMTPRIDMIAVPKDIGLGELLDVVVDEGHSRIPIYEGTIDNIIGVLLTKDLMPVLAEATRGRLEGFDVTRLMREPYFVPDTKPVDEILQDFRRLSIHLAVVIDEFGGTYGLVTMEDLLEEIVGEIQDEYDVEEPDFTDTPEGDVLIDGGASISEVNERFGLAIPEEDFDTIGGYVFGTLGRVPVPGDTVDAFGERGEQVLEVEELEDRRVTRVRLRRSGALVTPDS